ncbi:helix-turn-helix domain-containing protein [Microbulbifer agarilyticus]
MIINISNGAFGRLLKFWRKVYQVSQEELASRIDSSARHISRLENGENQASKEMVEKIAQAMRLSDRDTTNLLFSAGFVTSLTPADVSDPQFEYRHKALKQQLHAIEPLPSVVVDIVGNVVMCNRAWEVLLQENSGSDEGVPSGNLFEWMFYLSRQSSDSEEWQGALSVLLLSIQQTLLFSNNAEVAELLDNLLKSPHVPNNWQQLAASRPPARQLSIELKIDGQIERFSSFSQSINLLGPLTFSATPDLIHVSFRPEREDFDLSRLSVP